MFSRFTVAIAALLAAVACDAPEKLRPDEPTAVPTRCEGAGAVRSGPFAEPDHHLLEVVDARLAPLVIARARDAGFTEMIERTDYVYDPAGRLQTAILDGNGDGRPEFFEDWTWTDDGRPLLKQVTDARGNDRGTDYYVYARYGRLYRELRDRTFEDGVEEIVEHTWDSHGRELGADTWNPIDETRITRLQVEYLADWPSMDRTERRDLTGDNRVDETLDHFHGDDGRLERTVLNEDTVTWYLWDEAGRLVSTATLGPSRTETAEYLWTDEGLPLWSRVDVDDDLDGESESVAITDWEWTCV